MPTLNRDPRWRRLLEQQFRCSTCDELHQGLFDLACVKPDQWQGSEIYALHGHDLREQFDN